MNVRFIKYPNGYQCRIYYKKVNDDIDDFAFNASRAQDDFDSLVEDSKNLDVFIPLDDDVLVPFDDDSSDTVVSSDRDRSVASSRNRTLNNIIYICRSNVWDWFFTFTLNPNYKGRTKIDRYDYVSIQKLITTWLNHLRVRAPDLKYIVIPEKHKDGAYHFHGLFSGIPDSMFTYSGHDDASGNPIYNFDSFKFGYTTATRIQDNERVTKYVCKYITKDICASTLNRKRYWCSRNVNKAEIEDMFISDLNVFYNNLVPFIKHAKRLDVFDDFKIEYLELDCDFKIGDDCDDFKEE